ncbi:MAG: T9SS type A sorting domain-containing protein [Flavobacteriaceae bacterium]|nr:T9SS type A sorting domain-containing protein [Flavobacteriaceae bacterium]
MKKNYINFLLIPILLLCSGSIHGQNVITDGDFSTTTEIVNILSSDPQPMNTWSYYVAEWEDVSASATVDNGVCKFEIFNLGFNQNFWKIQLIQQGFELTQGHAYEISFDVKADAYRWFRVFLGEVGGNWTSFIGHDQWHEAQEGWQTITIPFEAWAVFPLHKLSFELGDDATTTYFDNISITDLGLAQHSIGIIGDAVNGWNDEDEIDMVTTDWINYSLTNQFLNPGPFRFRQDGNWDVNWGGETFPNGHVIFHGPDLFIPYPAYFDINFNRLTGEYSFECVADCPLQISMVGTALHGWDEDFDMQTEDGITYFLSDLYFSTGEAKFRQDRDWAVNWGSDTFPTGIAVLNGPHIPVTEGFYNVTFNWQTGVYNFDMPTIGILGSALNGWWEDIDLQSDDGIIYTINELYLNEGEVKFRLNDRWIVNWGSESFPMGLGFQNGPNIPVPEGTYNITFNKFSGEYSFVATTCPNPEIICAEDIYEDSSFGMCGSYVYYPEIMPVPNCGGDGITIMQTSGLPSGNLFPVGITTNTFEITNETGDVATCSFNVYVTDTESPVIMNLNEDYEPLWPPNHQMVEIYLDYTVIDNCSTTTEIMVSSNEPENGLGDGDMYPDWEIVDEHNVLLRAERSGNGNGREYYITIKVYDDSLNYTEQQVIVTVPHDRSSNNLQTSRVLLYPNAANKAINIKGLELAESISYQIFDMFGIVKDNGLLINDKIDIHGLPEGMYLIKLETENGSYFKKFLKN